MSGLGIVLLVVLLLIALGGLPRWGYHQYGYMPSSLSGSLLLIVIVLVLMGRL